MGAETEKRDKTKLLMERKGTKQKQGGHKRCKQAKAMTEKDRREGHLSEVSEIREIVKERCLSPRTNRV